MKRHVNLVKTSSGEARGGAKGDALRREASEILISGRSARVENRVGLRVAKEAGSALEPGDVAAGVDGHVEVGGGAPNSDAGEVLAAVLAESGRDGGLKAGEEGLVVGLVAGEAGEREGGVVGGGGGGRERGARD